MAVHLMVATILLYFNDLSPHLNETFIQFRTEIADRIECATRRNDENGRPYLHAHFTLNYGFKLVPMRIREVVQPFDHSLACWRELDITKRVSDLRLNGISPSFAYYNQWSYLENLGSVGFDNSAMAETFERSRVAADVLDHLRSSRRELGDGKAEAELNEQLRESIEFTQSYLLLSTTAMIHTLEDVGDTLQTVCDLMPPDAFITNSKNIDRFTTILFEYVYAAHCLHSVAGVVHGDLHSNNLTIMPSEMPTVIPNYMPDEKFLFVTGPHGETNSYVLPAAEQTGCFIDYSRSLLGPAYTPRLLEGRDEHYVRNFYRDQVSRVMATLHRHAADYVTRNQQAIHEAVMTDYASVFPVLCATDFVMLGMTCREALSRYSAEAPRLLERCVAIEEAGRRALVAGLYALVEKRGLASSQSEGQWPGPAVLEAAYGDMLFAKTAGAVRVMGMYNINNVEQWHGDDYASFPPWAKAEELLTFRGDYDVARAFCGLRADALTKDASAPEVAAALLRAELERLDGPAPALTHSWFE